MGLPAGHAVIIVSPYKHVQPQYRKEEHTPERIGYFDWIEALRMLARSAERFGYSVYALTDTELPVPHMRFHTKQQKLMLWILEVSLAYLRSDQFEEDTIMVCPDSLINYHFQPMGSMGTFDLGVCVRFAEKYRERPILNSVQFWPVRAKKKLAQFYLECYTIAKALPEDDAWGNDTIPLIQLLSPMEMGVHERAGMQVAMLQAESIMWSVTGSDLRLIEDGKRPIEHQTPVIDFKADRKKHMRAYYEAMMYENGQWLGLP